jgi:hypothetical protein
MFYKCGNQAPVFDSKFKFSDQMHAFWAIFAISAVLFAMFADAGNFILNELKAAFLNRKFVQGLSQRAMPGVETKIQTHSDVKIKEQDRSKFPADFQWTDFLGRRPRTIRPSDFNKELAQLDSTIVNPVARNIGAHHHKVNPKKHQR